MAKELKDQEPTKSEGSETIDGLNDMFDAFDSEEDDSQEWSQDDHTEDTSDEGGDHEDENLEEDGEDDVGEGEEDDSEDDSDDAADTDDDDGDDDTSDSRSESEELKALRLELAELRGMLKGQKPEEKPSDDSAKDSSEDVAFMTEEEATAILEEGNPKALHSVLSKTAAIAAKAARREMLKDIPGIMQTLLQRSTAEQTRAQAFLQANSDLVPYVEDLKPFAARLQKQNPDWSEERLLEELPKRFRKHFNMTPPGKKPKHNKKKPKGQPSNSGRSGGPGNKQNKQNKRKPDGLQSQVDSMFD